MKHISYIALVILIALVSHSCADEGPEPLFKLSINLTPVSITPITATFKVDAVLPEGGEINYAIAKTSESNSQYGDYDGDYLIFPYLSPNTEYKIEIRILCDSNYDYDWDERNIYLTSDNWTFRTKTEGDFSDIGKAIVTVIKSYSTSVAMQVRLPEFVYSNSTDNLAIKYGKTPDLSGDDTRTVAYYAKDGIFPYGMISGYDSYNNSGSIDVSLFNLEKDTKYYFEVLGDFYYHFSNESTELSYNSIECEPSYITTTSEVFAIPESIGISTWSTGSSNEMAFSFYDNNFILNTDGNPAILYYSTNSDIDINTADKTYLEYSSTYGYYKAKFKNLTYGETYYYVIQGKFAIRNNDYYYYEYDGLIGPYSFSWW